ncbi:relaxase/mobilization nuclease domain-containing protein [Streptococcus suis]|uniref:helical hairpin domain-containing protein n=1 Tax=Streptococcus suis TaxID=1307 RepID=UPI00209C5F2E|nr:relaxase/mobilization nuclease domain-containing protein [Streptococcus suis]MCO8204749.1 relaxase/mobilization nuclease domain-containing protein [Streptococcus suis]HEM3454396.1 relaxase/mobilization nuclease domain-containing protein [Streptococcus suis]
MVVLKIVQIKSSQSLGRSVKYIKDEAKTIEENKLQDVARAMKYIQNDAKTILQSDNELRDFPLVTVNGKQELQLVSSYGVTDVASAADEFDLTRMNAETRFGKRGNGVDVLAHHIIQSFSPEDDLTPQEIHEIGRKTVLELTGGQHEFVIATHIDKNHIHNHIIFNNTNSVTMKKFRWQKGTRRSLQNISDKHASIAGAKIIDEKMKNSRREYIAYRKKNVFRYEIKDRLDFLLKHSTSLDDFKLKAKELDLMLDTSGKEVRYKLLDKDQQRAVRDRTLSKRGNYSLEGITQSLEGNQSTYSIDEIKTAYQEYKKSQEDDFEMRIQVHDWQVMEETAKGIYLELEHGLANKGTVLIPSRYVDKLENGDYEIFIRKHDWFYFTNANDATKNKAMRGEIIAKQLSYDNGEIVVNKNPYISRLDQLVREFNFLSAHGVTDGTQFENLANSFREQVQSTQVELDKLDIRLADLNKLQGALLALEGGQLHYHQLAHQILKDLKLDPTTKKSEIDKLIKEVTIERTGLRERFDSIVSNSQQLEKIQDHIKIRESNPKKIL